MKSEWGISKFISKGVISDKSNGYLVKDNCVFGAEVFVVKSAVVTECLSLKNNDFPYTHDWKIPNFSQVVDAWKSEEFSAGGHKWMIWLYPKGLTQGNGCYVSIYLQNVTLKISERVKAHYTISIRNQVSDQHNQLTVNSRWFTDTQSGWGWTSFPEIAKINDPKNGFIVNDTCLLNIQLSVQAITI